LIQDAVPDGYWSGPDEVFGLRTKPRPETDGSKRTLNRAGKGSWMLLETMGVRGLKSDYT